MVSLPGIGHGEREEYVPVRLCASSLTLTSPHPDTTPAEFRTTRRRGRASEGGGDAGIAISARGAAREPVAWPAPG
jgi:hypothetical protein